MQQFVIATTEVEAGSGLDSSLSAIDESRLNSAQLLELAIDSQRLESFAAARRIEALAAFGRAQIAEVDRDAERSYRELSRSRGFRDEMIARLPRYAGDEAAAALDWSITLGKTKVLDAMFAVRCFPRATAALKAGRMDEQRHRFVIEKARHLDSTHACELDAEMDRWPDGLSRRQFNDRVRSRIVIADQEGSAERHARVCRDRGVSFLPDDDGGATLIAQGPADGLRALFARLDAVVRSEMDGRSGGAQESAGGAGEPRPVNALRVLDDPNSANVPSAPSDLRTLDQKRFDALAGAEIGDTTARRLVGRQAKLNVTVPVLTLMGYLDLPGQLDGYGPIPADMARALAGEATSWSRILLDPITGRVLEKDRRRYRPTAPLAEFVRERHRTCTAPGCHKPSERCEIDHLRPFDHDDPSAGGPTDSGNLHPACHHHHEGKTRGVLAATAVDPGNRRSRGRDSSSPPIFFPSRDLVIRLNYPSGRYYDVCDDADSDSTAASVRFAQGVMAEVDEPEYDPDDPLGENSIVAETARPDDDPPPF